MGQELVRAPRAVRVLGDAQDLERATRVARGRLGVVALGVQARLRPVEVDADVRVDGVLADGERPTSISSARPKLPLSMSASPRSRLEADPLELIVALLGRRQRALEDGDRRLELADHRICAPERVCEIGGVSPLAFP